ncbi:MAG: nitronate monooxygenase [bacterium]|nr:nitronate monooxygenase [bacterium]
MKLPGMPELRIGDLVAKIPIVQGGMGVGYSLSGLASSVAEAGGIGVIAAAGIGRLDPDWAKDTHAANMRALRSEIRLTRQLTDGILGINLMLALADFDNLCRASIEEGADILFLSAGLPLKPPKGMDLDYLRSMHTRIAPKISSARAASLIFKHWSKSFSLVPDAVVVEGPKAGGHQGFRKQDLNDPAFALENILPGVIEAVAPYEQRYGRAIPVIAGGGVYTGEDIHRILGMSAQGVMMGTRFVATHECDVHDSVKQAYIDCSEDDLGIIDSPVGLPGRAIINRYLRDVSAGIKKPYKCLWRCLRTCNIRKAPYCIAQALTKARDGLLDEGFAFAGANAFRVEKLMSVKELIAELMRDYQRVAAGGPPQPDRA